MAVKFLDKTGLGYFWNKIKAWCNATFAAITHSHAWSTITGKPTTISGYGITDAKIDNGTITLGSNNITPLINDNNYVHKTGTESINGEKTFLEGVTVTRNSNSNARYLLASGNIEKGNTLPDTVKVIGNLQFTDEQGHYFGELTCDVDENGTFLNLIAYNFTDVDTYTVANIIKLAHFHNGVMAAYTNPPPVDSVGSEIVTASWVRNHLSGSYVDTSSTQTISGHKKFLSYITVPSLELIPSNGSTHGGYIDFHYNGEQSDYSSRIIESARGYISINDVSIANSAITAGMHGGTVPLISGISHNRLSNSFIYTSGQYLKGFSSGQTYAGSSNNVNLISYPVNGTDESEDHTKANVQNLRLGWSDTYFQDIFMSPNNHYIWHRDIQNGTAYLWRRIVEENVNGITAPNWNINISGIAQGCLPLTGGTFTGNFLEVRQNPVIQLKNTSAYAKSYDGSSVRSSGIIMYGNEDGYTDNTTIGRYLIYQSVDGSGNALTTSNIALWRSTSTHDYNSVSLLQYHDTTYGSTFLPQPDNSIALGTSNFRWRQIYSASGTINTSDKRLKDNISDIDANLLNAWENIEWKQFKFKDAISEKGNNARLHTGAIAQEILQICLDYNIDINKYGLFCHDSWVSSEAVYDESGSLLSPAIEAGDCYSLRYEEMLCVEAAYQRRKNKILENRISELEKRLAKLEGTV